MSAQLVRNGYLKNHIRIFEPSKYHHYQPGWTMLGGGLASPKDLITTNEKMIPLGIPWTERDVTKIDPENNTIETEDGAKFTYDQLIISTGIQCNYDAVKGLSDALNNPNVPVGTIYNAKFAQKWSRIRENFNGKTALFCDPNPPIKCGGAPQKIMYLSHDYWNNKKRIHPEINYYVSNPFIFTQPDYAKKLEAIAAKKGINVNFEHNLVEIRGNEQVAVFHNKKTGTNVDVHFDAFHVVPPQKPQDVIKETKALVNEAGYVDVNQHTLQSNRYKNVWALGDCTTLPTSKTASAVMEQTPILVHNVLQTIKGFGTHDKLASYYGYTACPIFVGGNKLLLAEFKYNVQKDPTFGPLNDSPQTIFYYMKTKLFPFAYFNLMRRGLWYGRHGIFRPRLEENGEVQRAST